MPATTWRTSPPISTASLRSLFEPLMASAFLISPILISMDWKSSKEISSFFLSCVPLPLDPASFILSMKIFSSSLTNFSSRRSKRISGVPRLWPESRGTRASSKAILLTSPGMPSCFQAFCIFAGITGSIRITSALAICRQLRRTEPAASLSLLTSFQGSWLWK